MTMPDTLASDVDLQDLLLAARGGATDRLVLAVCGLADRFRDSRAESIPSVIPGQHAVTVQQTDQTIKEMVGAYSGFTFFELGGALAMTLGVIYVMKKGTDH